MADNKQSLPSTTLVIFGVSGDLAHRYLLPAMAEICQNSDIRAHLKILGLSRRDITPEAVLTDETISLKNQFQTLRMDYNQAGEYQKLKLRLDEHGSKQVIFYFAVPPAAVLPIVSNLGQAGFNDPKYRLLMEKPFGTDLQSSKKLVGQTQKYFEEEQIYRIDHFLAKEMAQNIAVFLGSNVLFRDVWHKEFIEYIEVVAAESIGIEGRAELWESTGILRDFVQSHLLQLAALTLMEPCPPDFDFADLPKRRLAALQQLSVPADKLDTSVVRGQYEGYREEVDNPKSTAETFAALQLQSSDPRWQAVPIYLACGKNLDQKLTQIRINFKRGSETEANMLVLRVQPREGIELDLWVKRPGYERAVEKKTLSFSYEQDFKDRLPNAYEQILVDAIRGSHSLFASSQEVLESWRILQPIIDYWKLSKDDLIIYKPGSSVEEVLQNT
jgi:glucose-6-phosphate 1-dehydrogenase